MTRSTVDTFPENDISARRMAGRIAALLPAGVALDVREIGDAAGSLFPVEREAVARAVAKRTREFSTGRLCARAAMAALGVPPHPVPVGPQREPVWPDGLVGTISHGGELCLAAVARKDHLLGLGIDLEVGDPLDPEVRGLICTPDELRGASAWAGAGVDPHKLVFSAKEALYKVLFPRARRFIDFLEVEIGVDADAGTWRPTSLPADVSARMAAPIEGKFLVADGYVVTAAWASPPPAGG
ncbi:MAG: 4'-phosphopantetheinyl transferase superfamily protein [Longimicrobiaceae bacterium]